MARGMQATHRKITELAAQMMSGRQRTLMDLMARERPESIVSHLAAIQDCHFQLGMCYWWTEQYEPAHRHWQTSLEFGRQSLEAYLRQGRARPEEVSGTVLLAAETAHFLGQMEQAAQLLEHTQRFAAGLRPGEERPPHPANTVDEFAIYPNIRAYSLVRLRRLEGFAASTYIRQWPDVRTEEPEWRPADIYGLLHTSEMCMALARAEGQDVFMEEKALVPLLRAIARCLQNPGPGLQKEAQQAFREYLGKIQHLGHFWNMLPRALDLQTAFPEIITPLLPPARP